MKNSIRLFALAIITLATSSLCLANWYNHPICTNGGTILSWHSTYNDYNGGDFTSSDAPGGTIIPAANLRGIYQRAPLLTGHTRGGSFPVYNGPSRTSIRGWINVLVYYNSDNHTINHYTSNYTSGSGGNQYPTKTW